LSIRDRLFRENWRFLRFAASQVTAPQFFEVLCMFGWGISGKTSSRVSSNLMMLSSWLFM
jgi:hypothetical protein